MLSDLLLEMVNPVTLDVTLTVQQELQARLDESDRLRKQQVEQARYEAELAQRRYLRVDPENRLVADSLEALNNGGEALQAQARAQQSAQESVDLTRESYHEGSVGILQVLDAERLYQQARLGYVRAQAQRYIDTVQLFLALGGAGPNGG